MFTNLRLPPPPSLPSPSSLGMDTFGLSNKKGGAPTALGESAQSGFVAPEAQRSNAGLMGVGIAVGVLAAGGLAFFVLGRATSDVDGAIPSSKSSSLAATASAQSSATSIPREVVVSAVESGDPVVASVSHRASASGKVPPSATAPSAHKTSAATSEPTSPTSAPTPTTTSTDPPCKIRDLDGTLRDCPKN